MADSVNFRGPFHDWGMSSGCSLTDRLSNNSVKTVYAPQCSGFSLDHFHMGEGGEGICPPPMTSARGQSVNGGGPHDGGHRPYGGDLNFIDYIIN